MNTNRSTIGVKKGLTLGVLNALKESAEIKEVQILNTKKEIVLNVNKEYNKKYWATFEGFQINELWTSRREIMIASYGDKLKEETRIFLSYELGDVIDKKGYNKLKNIWKNRVLPNVDSMVLGKEELEHPRRTLKSLIKNNISISKEDYKLLQEAIKETEEEFTKRKENELMGTPYYENLKNVIVK